MPERIAWGSLTFFHAFDVGHEIELAAARMLGAASEAPGLAGLRPGPPHLQYQPRPLVLPERPVVLCTGEGELSLDVSVKVFDFGALSVRLSLPVRNRPWNDFIAMALELATGNAVEQAARSAAEDAFERLHAAILRPRMSPLTEEYCLWHVGEFAPLVDGGSLLREVPQDLARLIMLERGTFGESALEEILRGPIQYHSSDLVLVDWNAAFALDPTVQDTAEVLEFLNVQLLELRIFDRLLHESLDELSDELYRKRFRLPFFPDRYGKVLQRISELRMEVSLVQERIYNTLKLMGDVYLARICEEARRKVGAERWEATIRTQLRTLEDIYSILNHRAEASRAEALEVIIILLIAFEIVLGLLRH